MKKLIVIFLLLLGFVLPSRLFAATVIEEWVARYNGPANSFDMALAIAVDNSGNVYVTGDSYATDTGGDYATIKYDTNGNQLWVARYNGPANSSDGANAIAVDSSGNVYVTGYSFGISTGWDYATVKYDTNGNQLWVARYNGPSVSSFVPADGAWAIAVDSSGNVYVTGDSWSRVDTYYDYATIKYDTNGNQLWVARYNGPANSFDGAKAIAVDSSGNVYVTGSSYGTDTDSDYATIKYDTNGNQLWVARYNDPANYPDIANAIAVDSSGNVYVTGYSYGIDTDSDYATVKYDTNGNQLWVARYNGTANSSDGAWAIAVDSSGNVYVTGSSWSTDTGTANDYATVKYDTNGNQLWVARYDGPGTSYPPYMANDVAWAMALDNSGNVYVTGYSSGTYYDYDYATVKYDTNGNQLWVARYDGPGTSYPPYMVNDWAWAIAVDSSGNVYVTGSSYGIGTDDDYVTVKYSQVQDPAETIRELITIVISFNLKQGIENSLVAKLQNALAALDAANADQRQDAVNKLEAFINSVEAQRGKALTDEQADILINKANDIILLLQ